MKDFLHGDWKELLRLHDLDSFEGLWKADAPWFEERNERLGGWSGVSRIVLEDPGGASRALFLKRQRNHTRPSFRPPHFRTATAEREMRFLVRFGKWGIPTARPVFFGVRRTNGEVRTVLVTEALERFLSLDEWAKEAREGRLAPASRTKLIRAAADAVRCVHRRGFEHGNLRGRHVLARVDSGDGSGGGSAEVRLIDLEGVRRHGRRRIRDLVKLALNTSGWTRQDQLRFILRYLEAARLTPRAKTFLRRLARAVVLRREVLRRRRE